MPDDTCILVSFQALPTLSPEGDALHSDGYYCTFACLGSHPDPEHLLDEVLGLQNLYRNQSGEFLPVSKSTDWGSNEGLKKGIDEKGWGLSKTRMHFPTI